MRASVKWELTVFDPNTSIESRQNKVNYAQIRNDFSLKVTDILIAEKVQEDVANEIPVVPVGLVSQPIIPSDERKVSWLDEFWSSVFRRLKAAKLQPDAIEPHTSPRTSPAPSTIPAPEVKCWCNWYWKVLYISFIVPVILGHFRYIKEEVFGIIVVCIFICMGILLFF